MVKASKKKQGVCKVANAYLEGVIWPLVPDSCPLIFLRTQESGTSKQGAVHLFNL